MKRHVVMVAVLALATVVAAANQPARAQLLQAAYSSYQNNSGDSESVVQAQPEELPADLTTGGSYEIGGYPADSDSGDCDTGCNECCEPSYGSSWYIDDGWVTQPGTFFMTAEYLYVRANYSDAVSFLEQDDSQQNFGTDEFHQLNFRHESSYRVGGGYRLCNCDEEIRFLFTRLSSFADQDEAQLGDFIPYEVSPPPDGRTLINADVEVKSYDLEYVKTIPLGGQCEKCGCNGSCGCVDQCTACNSCPTWDITWSGGIRFAEADWERSYVAVDSNDAVATDARSVMNFEGGGLKVGLEGRRYFGQCGWFSIFLKGDISLLLGHVDLVATRVVEGGTAPDLVNIQSNNIRQIIPVTEIEAGMTTQLTSFASVSAGYLFSAWHDLGFRDQFALDNVAFMETGYDDANILGFDGMFVRLETDF